MTRDFKKQYEWKRKNNVYIGLGLSKTTDADIIEYIEDRVEAGETRQGIIKRSLRSTMRVEGYDHEREADDEES